MPSEKEKQSSMIKVDGIITKHLGFEGKTDDKRWLQSSVKSYLESGKISGSFYQAIVSIIEDIGKTEEVKGNWEEHEKEMWEAFGNFCTAIKKQLTK